MALCTITCSTATLHIVYKFTILNCFCSLGKELDSTIALSYRTFATHNAHRYPLSNALCNIFQTALLNKLLTALSLLQHQYKSLFVNFDTNTDMNTVKNTDTSTDTNTHTNTNTDTNTYKNAVTNC